MTRKPPPHAPLPRTLLPRLLLAAGCFAAALAGAALLHHETRHAPAATRVTVAPPLADGAVAALAAAPQRPLAAPAAAKAAATVAAQARALPAVELPAGTAGTGGAGGGHPGTAGPDTGHPGTAGAGVGSAGTAAATGAPGTGGGGVSGDPLLLSAWQRLDPGVVRQVDVCAAGHPPAGCPAGLPATIGPPATIGLGGGMFGIVDVQVDVQPYLRGVYDECLRDNVVPGGTDGVVAVLTTAPARITLSGAVQRSFATTERARGYWAGRQGDGPPDAVVTCVALPRTSHGDVTVTASPMAGTGQDTRAVALSFRAGTGGGRPPVTIHPVGDTALQLWVPLREQERAVVITYRLAAGAGTGPSCGSHPGPDRPADATATTGAVTAVALPAGGGYAYDPAWDRVQNATLVLPDRSEYELCVQWTDQDASFDAYRVVDAEARVVGAPATQTARLGVLGIVSGTGALPAGFDARTVRLPLTDTGMAPRQCDVAYAGLPGLPAPGQLATRPVPVCTPIDTSGTGQYLYVGARYGDRVADTVVPLSARACTAGGAVVPGCAGMHETRLVPLPAGTGGGYAATLVLRVDYSVPPGVTDPSRADWEIGAPTTVGADAGTDVPAPITGPQLDSLVTEARVVNGAPVLVWKANELVRLDIRLAADPTTCDRPSQAVSVPTLAVQGRVDLTGLCYGTAYQLTVTATDHQGRGVTVDSLAGYRLGLHTDPAHVRYHMTVLPRAAQIPANSALRIWNISTYLDGALGYQDYVSSWDPGLLGLFASEVPFDNLRCVSFSGPHPQNLNLAGNGVATGLTGDWSTLVSLRVDWFAFLVPGDCGTHVPGAIIDHGDPLSPYGWGDPVTFALPTDGYVQVVDPTGYWIAQIYLDR